MASLSPALGGGSLSVMERGVEGYELLHRAIGNALTVGFFVANGPSSASIANVRGGREIRRRRWKPSFLYEEEDPKDG